MILLKHCAKNRSDYYERFRTLAKDSFVYDCGNGCLIGIIEESGEPKLLEMSHDLREAYLKDLRINQLCRKLTESNLEIYQSEDLNLTINDKFELFYNALEALGKVYLGEHLFKAVVKYLEERQRVEGIDKRRSEYKRFKERWAWLEQYHINAIRFVETLNGIKLLKL